MPRIVSVWLPQWPVHRRLAAERRRPPQTPVDPARPFVIARGAEAADIVAVNPAAATAGLAVGERLADARARMGALQVRRAEPLRDAAALRRLAHWATRYTPSAALFAAESGADGFFLDITGAAHLVGGEERLLADLGQRLAAFGLPARLAIAETPGAAWAVSHFTRTPHAIVAAGAEAEALARLPIEGLRIAPEAALTLRRLGFKAIGVLIDKPRAPFAVRFERELLLRLDRALGRTPEPLALITPPPVYAKARSLLDPIDSEEAIVATASGLMGDLVADLEADGAGARALRLTLYRVDGVVEDIDVGLAEATQSPDHVARLIRLKLERTARLDAGFGFETVRLAVTAAQPLAPRQRTLADSDDAERARRCTLLIDALRQRLGPRSVCRLVPVASHWPERSEMLTHAVGREVSRAGAGETSNRPHAEIRRPRPPLLLPRPEPADVIALVPDGPPQRIRWRGALHAVAHAEGPERIAAEWWRDGAGAPTRDYYLVEDAAGRRVWLYREGIPGRETAGARWFVHGLFP